MATKTEQFRALQAELADIRERIGERMLDKRDVSDHLLRVIWQEEEDPKTQEMLEYSLRGIKADLDELIEQRKMLQAAKVELDVCHECGRHD